MHIGYDVTTLEGQMTGVGYYSTHLLAHLVQRTDPWHYELLSNRQPSHLWPALHGAVARTRGPRGPFMPLRPLWLQMVLPFSLRRLNLDLCHFTNSLLPLAAHGRLIVTIHDMSLFLWPHYHRPRSLLLARPLIRPSARRAQAIITVSASAKADILRVLGVPAASVHVVYEAAAPPFRQLHDAGALASARARYALSDTFVLYAGTVEPRKNLVRLVEALAAVHRRGLRVPLVIAGQWGPLPYHALKAAIERLGMQQAVRFMGYVPTADLAALLNLATVFVFPSLYEGFGLPIVEAMACGAPVLTSNCSAPAEIAGAAATLANPLDSQALAEGLYTLLTDADLRASQRQRGLARAAEFSWPRAAAETAALYRQVMTA